MRAEQWMMVGVAAIGVYAVYRLTKKNMLLTPGEPDRGTPTPIHIPYSTLPDLPQQVPVPIAQDIRVIEGNPMKLMPAAWYHGRIELVDFQGNRSTYFTDSGIGQQLQAMGFKNVTVFDTPQEASTDIYVGYTLSGPGKGTRWFRARWPFANANGDPMPTEVPRVSGLVLLWQAAPPAGG